MGYKVTIKLQHFRSARKKVPSNDFDTNSRLVSFVTHDVPVSSRLQNPLRVVHPIGAGKIIINSAYGFWGIRVEDKDSVLIQEKGACDIHDYINRGKFLNYTEIGKYGVARVLKDLPIKDFNVGVASAISSYSRCRLWSLIDGIESNGKRVFMCDTDSVIIDANRGTSGRRRGAETPLET